MAHATCVEPEPAAAAPTHLHDLLALARRAPGAVAFARELLPLLARHFECPAVAIELRTPGRVIHETHATDAEQREFWMAPLEQLLTETLAEREPRVRTWKARTGAGSVATVAAPVLDARGDSIGAVALVRACDDPDSARLFANEVFALAALVGGGLDTMAAASARTPAPGGSDPAAAQALRKSSEFGSSLELFYSLANSLRNKTGCERVALGGVRGRRVRVECVSGLDEVPRDSPYVRALHAALEECLDAGQRLVCQPHAADAAAAELTTGHRLHRQWHYATSGACVASLPLALAGKPLVILALQRAGERPFQAEELDGIQKLIEPYLPAIELIDRARGSLLHHAARVVREEMDRLRKPRGLLRALTIAAPLAFVAWIGLGTTSYDFGVPCRVRPAESRHLTAPFDGLLLEAPLRAGDRVRAGDLLARLDTGELELESARLRHEIEEVAIDERRSFAARDLAGGERLRARQDELEAQLGGVERRIAAAKLLAPFDGYVLRGDRSQQVGSTLVRGEELFELAPDEQVRFDLFVPESRIADVRAGFVARFSPFARPEHDEPLIVTRVAPASEIHEGRNVFVLEAESAASPEWMRPGLEGVAELEAGERRVAWVLTHRLVDWVRLHLWP